MAVTWTLLGSGTTGGSPTSGGTSTSGARFAVAIAWDAGQTISSVVDSKGNSYSAVGTAQADGQGGLCQWYFSAGGSAGASHTATVSFSGSAFPSISFYQITDGASSAHSGSAQGQDSGGQPFVLTSGTMPSGNWSAGAICSNNTGSDGAYSANASTPTFTLLHSEGTVSSFWTHGVSWASSSGTGAVTPSFNRSGTAGSTTGMAILVIEESIAGGGPAITTTSSATPVPGDSLTITGTDFQASQGAGYVTLGGVTQTVTSWADTSITITVVRGTAKYGSQNIVVRDNGGADSSGYAVTLTPPTGWGYVDLASVNSTAAWRIITRPDLAVGDQIAYQTAGGLVVANDGTFSWTFGAIRSFDAEVWTSADGWGAVFTQYLAPAFSTPPQPPSQIPRIQRRWPRAAPDPFDIVGSKTGVEKWFAWELTVATGGGITADAADTATFSDSAVSTSERLSTAADTFTPSDSAVSVSERLAVASDTFAPSDSAVSVSALVAVAVDTVTFSDSAVETPAFAAEASDTFTPSDSAVSTTDRLAVAADTFAPSDSAVSTSDRLATASDTFSLSDTAVSTSDRPATASDTFSPSDSADALNAIPSDGADTVTFSDSALSTSDRTAAASDTFSPSDSAVSTTDRPAVADDTVTFSDSAVGSAAGGIAVDAADTITLTDSAVSVSARGADAADTFTPSDSAVSATDRVATATDALVFSDSAVAGTQPAAVAADTINLDDSAVAVTIAPTAGGGRAWLRSLLQERYTREFEAYAAARRAAEVRKSDPLATTARPLSEPAAPPAPRPAARRAKSSLERELETTLRQLLTVAKAPASVLVELPAPVNLNPVAGAVARAELTAEDEETLLQVAQMLNL